MPEMSRWHHVTGGIDLVPLDLMSLPFSGTQGKCTRIPSSGAGQDRIPARPWDWGIILGILLQTVTFQYLLQAALALALQVCFWDSQNHRMV